MKRRLLGAPVPRSAAPKVLHVTGPIVLDWGNGVRLQISPVGVHAPASTGIAAPSSGRRGRKPGPATQALIDAMNADAEKGKPRSRAEYLGILRDAGGPQGQGAYLVVNREARRAFGKPLPRGAGKRPASSRRGGGRQPSPVTTALREKLAHDKQKGDLRDAPYYIRWLVDQPGAKLGLKQARPVVYRELRVARE